MSSKQMRFLLVPAALIFCCALPLEGNAQRTRRAGQRQQPCDPDKWVEKVVKLGTPNTQIDVLSAGVVVEITDENGKPSSIGNYIHVVNYGDQPIEWVTFGNSPYHPVAAGEEDELLFLAMYRKSNDRTPTHATVVLRYKCNTKAGAKPLPNTSQDQGSTNQPQQQQSRQPSVQSPPQPNSTSLKTTQVTNQPFPLGCWKFTYVASDENLKTHAKLFNSDSTVTHWDLTDSEGKKLKPYPTTWKWELKGGEIVITSTFNGTEEPLRFDGSRLRGWYYNDNGDTPSNIRYYGVKDNGACIGLPLN